MHFSHTAPNISVQRTRRKTRAAEALAFGAGRPRGKTPSQLTDFYLGVGVNDRTNRAALVRLSSSFVERHVEDDFFTLHHLTHMGG